MYCQSCGTALLTEMKYCNRCGANLVTTKHDDRINLLENRMDSEMEGIFWVTVVGLGLILGGLVLLKKMGLSESVIVAFMILSSVLLLTNFGLGLWQLRRLNRSSKEASGTVPLEGQDTNELGPATPWPTIEAGSSVTEQTTRDWIEYRGTASRHEMISWSYLNEPGQAN